MAERHADARLDRHRRAASASPAASLLGIAGFRVAALDRSVIMPILDVMQTIPVFAYLLPILFLFGFSPVSALLATIIYAMPPMVRVTLLALDKRPAGDRRVRPHGRLHAAADSGARHDAGRRARR